MFDALLKGLTLGLLLSVLVGPVIFSILKQSLNNGFSGGLSFIVGVSFSDIVLVVISNVFAEWFGSLYAHKSAIGIAGSVFLISVGVYFLFFKKVQSDEHGRQSFKFRKRDYIKIALSGFFMNTLNPGAFFFWLTTSAAVIDHSIQQRIVIFVTCLVVVLSGDFAKVILAEKIRRRLTLKNINLLNRINGLILIGFGVALIWGLIFYGDKIKMPGSQGPTASSHLKKENSGIGFFNKSSANPDIKFEVYENLGDLNCPLLHDMHHGFFSESLSIHKKNGWKRDFHRRKCYFTPDI